MGLYEEISKNKRSSFLLIFLFCILIIALGYAFGLIFLGSGIAGMVIAFFIAVIWSLIGFYSGDKMILNMSKAKEVKKKDDPYLVNTVEGLAIAAGLKKAPKVYIIEEESPNAFATGRDPDKASTVLTK
jgi:heat shock protein HtpX